MAYIGYMVYKERLKTKMLWWILTAFDVSVIHKVQVDYIGGRIHFLSPAERVFKGSVTDSNFNCPVTFAVELTTQQIKAN